MNIGKGLTSDLGQKSNKLEKELCTFLSIHHHRTSVSHFWEEGTGEIKDRKLCAGRSRGSLPLISYTSTTDLPTARRERR